ncbi:TPA: hypothetical protein ACX3LH_001432, partial [Klebsiella michiganensis]
SIILIIKLFNVQKRLNCSQLPVTPDVTVSNDIAEKNDGQSADLNPLRCCFYRSPSHITLITSSCKN